MEYDKKLLFDLKKLLIARYPCFAAEIVDTNLEYRTDLMYHTAATDGKSIFFDPHYLASLNDDERLFISAHEVMHKKFKHMFRLIGKDGKKRDFDIWNVATDAIINANLERDGFKIKEGYVNMPEALNFSAEELYEKLLKEKQEQQKQPDKSQNSQQNQGQKGEAEQENGQEGKQSQQQNDSEAQQGQAGGQEQQGQSEEQCQQSGQSKQSQSGQGGGGQQFADDHSLWDKAFEESKQNSKGKNQNSGKKQSFSERTKDIKVDSTAKTPEIEEAEFNERGKFAENREIRREIARQKFEKMREQALHKHEIGNIEFGEVGKAKAILDWKQLLRREVEKTETIWSQRRSIAENNYAYRLEENDVEDEAETEVMIDVSGSVSLEMVKAFLRQLKPLLKESKLKVGCFNEKFWGMNEIKTDRDIDNFKIPSAAREDAAWTEDWDLAVRSFSKKREVNKIVFTDGVPGPGTMPQQDLKDINVIWLVYSNRNFQPCCGKVIDIYPNDLQKMINVTRSVEEPEL